MFLYSSEEVFKLEHSHKTKSQMHFELCFFFFFFKCCFFFPGEDSGKVMIWNMAPVLREEDEKNETVPKMLCQMDNHLGNKPNLLLFSC